MNVHSAHAEKAGLRTRLRSIRLRLAAFILVIILTVILVFGGIAYLGVRKSVEQVAYTRLTELRNQLATSFKPDTIVSTAQLRLATQRPAVRKLLLSGGRDSASEVDLLLNNLKNDSLNPQVELLSVSRQRLRSVSYGPAFFDIPADSIFSVAPAGQRTWMGKLYSFKDQVYYPVVASVTDGPAVIGYIIRWRRVYASGQILSILARLMGNNSAVYFGNRNDTLWTDMRSHMHAPPMKETTHKGIYEYRRNGELFFAGAGDIPNSPWRIIVEFRAGLIYQAANRFLYWLLAAGLVLLAVGGVIAVWLGGRISKRLRSLSVAARRIAEGDYQADHVMRDDGKDEIGQLAQTFNTMVEKIKVARNELVQLNQGLEEQVARRTAELQLVNEEMESFSYSVSHDLRAPLRAIHGYANILSEEYADRLGGEAGTYLATIRANAGSMGRLIDDLLAFSRLGRKEVQKTSLDFEQMLREILADTDREYPGHNAVITIGKLEPAAGDYNLMRQVWQNLVSNAVKYSSKKQDPEIQISSFRRGNETVYYIKDNGAGFDMKYADKLFGVFQRLHYDGEFEGTGIGLALIHRIITRHGGRVWAEGEVDKGAAFYFTTGQ